MNSVFGNGLDPGNLPLDELAFYGVSLELWQIDNSRPAVQFNVISRPAEIAPKNTLAKLDQLSDVKKL